MDRLSSFVLLSQQKTTSSSSETFDVSQFKRYVNKDDISLAVIKKLQQEFGTDIAGAIDKFYDMEKEAASKSSKLVNNATEVKNEETDKSKETKKFNEDALGRKDFVIRDQFWNPYRREYVTKKPAEAKESSKNKRYVMFARKEYQADMKTFNTVVLVYGKILRNALRNIFHGAMDFSLTDNENSELRDVRFLYWAKPELELLIEHYKSVDDKTAIFEIQAALNLIENVYKDMICLLPSLLPHWISFEHLWSLIPPGSLIVSRDDLGFTDIWRALGCAIRKRPDGTFLFITAEHIVWDGDEIGYSYKTLKIAEFSGLMMIDDLPYIPLKHHPNQEEVVQIVRQRSDKAIKFWERGYQLQEHQGTGLAEADDEIQRYAFSGRVVIDPSMMRSTQPSNIIMPSLRAMRHISRKSRAWISDLTTEEEYQLVLEELLKDANQAVHTSVREGGPASGLFGSSGSSSEPGSPIFLARRNTGEMSDIGTSDHMLHLTDLYQATPGQARASAKLPKNTVQLSDEQMLLVSSLLYGYSLREGMWGAFAVDRVSDVVWNNTAFPSLVMEPSIKSVIYQLVIAHSSDATDFDDLVKGKGKGLIGLLFGPPGSGKTLTAEAVAETARMPLYMVSSGGLGYDAVDIERSLSEILNLASHWKAVLLLDEADVFLAERTLTDIERNAIVSIFLRELEYYPGILLLTTNQAHVIDEAFHSRIHFSIHYPLLDSVARRTIWTNFLDNVRESKGIEVDVTSDDTLVLAEMPLNGRQIKNAVSIAVKIASNSKERTITSKAIISTAELLQSQDYHGKRSQATGDEETLERNSMKTHTASTQNTDDVPVKSMPRRLGSMRWSREAVCIIAVAALFALDFLLSAKLN